MAPLQGVEPQFHEAPVKVASDPVAGCLRLSDVRSDRTSGMQEITK